MHRILGVAQHYAWGDLSAIPSLLGLPADGSPWAEWWVGTHPGGAATLDDGQPLREISGDLPYLVKLLAAAEALSLQTHPDEATARDGFERENAAGIAVTDPRRIYRDPQAKPELLCAITEFDALCGFRPVADTVALLCAIGATSLADQLAGEGLERTVAALYRGTIPLAPILEACAAADREEAVLVTRLAQQYPDEPSVAVTLLLHRVHLQPHEALYLGPGNLHAYLRGFGLEVMGASDNVVRGGLTPKHVDVDELVRVLSYEPMIDPVVRAVQSNDGRWHYPTPQAPFELTRLEVEHRVSYRAQRDEVMMCTAGDALRGTRAAWLSSGDEIELVGPSTVFAIGRA